MSRKYPAVFLEILNKIYQKALNNSHDDLLHRAIAEGDGIVELLMQLGIECAKNNKLDDAIFIFERIKSVKKLDVSILYNLGLFYNLKGDYINAIDAYNLALERNPNDIESLVNKASCLIDIKLYSLALETLDTALCINPSIPEVWSNRAMALSKLNFDEQSLFSYNEAIRLNSGYSEAWSNRGVLLNKLKQFEEALESFGNALRLKDNYPEALLGQANSLYELGRYDASISSYEDALHLKSDYLEAWFGKGFVLQASGRHYEAIASYDAALDLRPSHAESWVGKANALLVLEREREAALCYETAIAIKPDYADAWFGKGSSLVGSGDYLVAIECQERALSLNQDIDWVYGANLHVKMKICQWDSFSGDVQNIALKIQSNKSVIVPFPLLALVDDGLLIKSATEYFSQKNFPPNRLLGPIKKQLKKEKISIGYFSFDFKDHAVAKLTVGLYEGHDRDKFEIYGFSLCKETADDEISKRLINGFDHFIQVSDKSDIEIARLARSLGIDIAVDLGGYSFGSRTAIFSYRAAPIQISYIGYLGTMGVEYYDYLFADNFLIPAELQQNYSEKIVYLPSYQVNDSKRPVVKKFFSRHELGLPETGFIFCCFNNNYKILPSLFDSWMKILRAVDDSILFLYAENEFVRVNLIREAEARGISGNRLVFAKRRPAAEYLSSYHVCDLFLDTWPYNAGTTASDALWVGLPVLTMAGKSFASRMAGSILSAIGLKELITFTPMEYESLAINLAQDFNKLAKIKKKLLSNRSTAALFNTQLFIESIEAAYVKIFKLYESGHQADHVTIVKNKVTS